LIVLTRLWVTLENMGAPKNIRTEVGNTNWFVVSKGVRLSSHQICLAFMVSPDLFGLYGEQTMRDAELDDANIGVKIGGRLINNLGYTNNTLAATNKNYLSDFLVQTTSKKSRSSI